MSFDYGDLVRRDDWSAFSNGADTVRVVPPKPDAISTSRDVTWLDTGDSPTYVLTARLRLVKAAPVAEWQTVTEDEISTLKRLGVKFEERTTIEIRLSN
jgi:hypothetical protein